MPTQIALALVSHTNVGKTTLARTLLGQDVGEVRDAPHVTEFAEQHLLLQTPEGDRLLLWDTPGFGDSARLARRLQQSAQPIGWFLAQVWDRFADRPFWSSQQALRAVRDEADVVLYLVNAAESPAGAGYVAPEMDLLAWVGQPVIVLLNQLGAPRPADEEAAECERWRAFLGPRVQAVLPLDAFARCWVQEEVLLLQLQQVLQGEARVALQRLHAAWHAAGQARLQQALQQLADSLARVAGDREPVPDSGMLRDTARRVGQWLRLPSSEDPATLAQQALATRLEEELRRSTAALVALHGLKGDAEREVLTRIATHFDVRLPVDEGQAAVLGGLVTGALAGLKADIATGGLTLGGGLLAGGLIGALGAAGAARAINHVRGGGSVAWSEAALAAQVEAALLRYLAVAHFGRGRGDWAAGEAPPHWRGVVAQALQPRRAELALLWRDRDDRLLLATALQALLVEVAHAVLGQLYPAVYHPRP
jgi:predicted GTPase